MPRFGSLFSGGGGADLGAIQVGFTPAWAVEYDKDIAGVYRTNIGNHIIADDVCNVDFSTLPYVEWLHASPVCTRYSVANNDKGESEIDTATALATVRAIQTIKPEYVTIENVVPYKNGEAYALICQALTEMGYFWDSGSYNSADYGVPQERRRLFVRASRGLLFPPPEPTRWVGWFDSVFDLLPSLPKTNFAAWQVRRLPKEIQESVLFANSTNGEEQQFRLASEPVFTVTTQTQPRFRAFIVDGKPGDNGSTVTLRYDEEPMFTVTTGTGYKQKVRALLVEGRNPNGGSDRWDYEPAQTVTTSHPPRAWMYNGRVVGMTPLACARFQAFPRWYVLPEKRELANRIVGNAVPPPMMAALFPGGVL